MALLTGHADLLALTESAQWLGVSIINVLEFRSFDGLSDADHQLFATLVSRFFVVELSHENSELITLISDVRQRKVIKLPDAIVAASAMHHQATVLTNDAQLLKLAVNNANHSAQPF